MDKISVIIPIHNGGKYINSLYKNISNQSFKNIEIIMVENFSKDNSLEILNEIAKKDGRVVVLESKIPGTSMARKKGVEYSTGKYTVFMDQDDKYLRNNALQKMYETIVETESQICQFSFFKDYGYGIRKNSKCTNERIVFSAEDVRKYEISSVLGGDGYITPTVWSKMFLTDVLKDAVKNIDVSLYFAEDQFLIVNCLLSDCLKCVCIDPASFYVWDTKTGFSSLKDSGMALMKDYEITKPLIHKKLKDENSDFEVLYRLHLESLYFMVAYLNARINEIDLNEAYELIEQVNSFDFIQLAKYFVNNELEEEKKYDELVFLSSNFTPEEFCERFKDRTFEKNKFRGLVKKLLRR